MSNLRCGAPAPRRARRLTGSATRRGARCAGAAVLGQVVDQGSHGVEVGRVNDEPALLAAANQPRMREVRQVERERRRRQLQLLSDRAGSKAAGPRHDEEPEDGEARLVRKARQGIDCLLGFHISRIIETMEPCQVVR